MTETPMSDDPPHVLLVDDEPVILALLRRILDEAGFFVEAVGTAEEALRCLGERTSQVVVTDATVRWTVVSDVQLPQMNGCTLGREIVQRWPGTRMLFISGYVPEVLYAMRICPGNIPLLPKPFTLTEFIRRVRQTLAEEPWTPDSWPVGEAEPFP